MRDQAGSELVFIKLGGSLITDKSTPYTVQQEVLDRLCREIRTARSQGNVSLVLGHGAGSFGHVSAARHGTHKGISGPDSWRGFSEVHHDAQRLNAMVREALAQAGEVAVTLQPSSACITKASRITSYHTEPIRRLLDAGVIPLLYGDACLDEEQGCSIASTEEILRHLAAVLRPSRIILVGKVDGVFGPSGELIPEITKQNFDAIKRSLQPSDGVADVTGGMLQKVTLSLQAGVPTEIINGLKPDLLARALAGEEQLGTAIIPG